MHDTRAANGVEGDHAPCPIRGNSLVGAPVSPCRGEASSLVSELRVGAPDIGGTGSSFAPHTSGPRAPRGAELGQPMGRFWNLRTKLVAVLVLVLSGTFLLQTVIHEHNEQQLLGELEKVAQQIANDTSDLIATQFEAQFAELARDGEAARAASRLFPAAGFHLVVSRDIPAGRRPEGRVRAPAGRVGGEGRSRQLVLLKLDATFMEELSRSMEMEMRQLRARSDRPTQEELFARLIGAIGAYREASAPPVYPEPLEDPSPTLITDTNPPAEDSLFPAATFTEIETELEVTPAASRGTALAAAPDAPTPDRLPDSVPAPVLDVTPHIDRVTELFNDSKRHDLIATLGVFLIGIALAWFLGVRVTRPVDDVVSGFQRLAAGDFEARVDERPNEEFGHLGRQFNAMVDRLREARDLERELEQRERVQHMGDLAAGVAHDVRNPLNAIHLNIGQIRDEFVPEDERSQERFLRFTSDVQREVERLNLLVTNFLSLAQPAAEQAEPVEPNELVEELFRLLRKEALGRHVDLALDLDEELPSVSWNRQEMKSAFLNIAINGLQAVGDAEGSEGGGHLVLATHVREARNGPELVVSFADDGPGIPLEDLERVFVPYYTTRKGGTGLGMAIARRTAERHGGRLELRSTEGEGTTVTFAFPIDPQRGPRGHEALTGEGGIA